MTHTPAPSAVATKERPILFGGPMVKAILEGRKTQTRRVIKPQPDGGVRLSPFVPSRLEDGHGKAIPVRFDLGDILWVRETWRVRGSHTDGYTAIDIANNKQHFSVAYQADITWNDDMYGKVRSPIFMPRALSRITLEVISVRVERVQDIRDADVRAEGVAWDCSYLNICNSNRCPTHLRDSNHMGTLPDFRKLWNEINGKRGYSWESNPWVWVIEFQRVH